VPHDLSHWNHNLKKGEGTLADWNDEMKMRPRVKKLTLSDQRSGMLSSESSMPNFL